MQRLLTYLSLLYTFFLFVSCNSNTHDEAEQRPTDYLFRQRAYPSGTIDQTAYQAAVKYRALALTNPPAHTKDLTTRPWHFAGPLNVGGRITDVERIPGNPGRVYIGTAAGGVFRSDDLGDSWAALTDELPSLAVGDLALAPSNNDIIYLGTGEANAGGGSIAYDGAGVFRSDDGGDSWTALGLENAGSIGRIVVDPSNPDRAYVAAMGTLFANNSERGVYRTLDSGENWEQVLFVSDSTGAIDLVIHPDAPNTLYAAMWERTRRPDRRQYTGATSGIYRSTDGGSTWQELTNGLPQQADQKGRISLAIAPSDPDRLYAGYVNDGGALGNLLTSLNGGDSWTPLSMLDLQTVPYDWWFNRLVVAPDDPEKLYYIGFNINEYLPEFQLWQRTFNGVHVDQHSLWIDPNDPQTMLVGNDGGIYYSTNGGLDYVQWNNLPITQFYTCEIDPHQPERLYGGTQDNGTNRTLTGALDDWERIYGGDGFRVRIDPTDQQYVYAAFQYGNIARSEDGGNFFFTATNGLEGSRRNWFTPYEIDPQNPTRLYLGAERVFRSDNRAQSWQPISPVLANAAGPDDNLVYGTITALAISPIDDQTIWVGTDAGEVWITTNGGNNWTDIAPDLPQRWVTSLTADPNNPDAAYITFSGYRYGTNMSHIYYTEDGGQNWLDINGNLPDIPVNDLAIHPSTQQLFLATDIGVFFSEDQGINWQLLGTELPPVIVMDLSLNAANELLVAATFGRSLWSIQLGEDVNTSQPAQLDLAWQIAPNPVIETTNIITNIPVTSHYTLRLLDQHGRLLKTLHAGVLPTGEHVLQWQTDNLPKGSYYLQWQGPDGSVATQQVAVQ